MAERTLVTPRGTLCYTYTEKHIRRLNLRIKRDGSLAVSAPLRTSKKVIEDFLLSHWDWIEKHRTRFSAMPSVKPLGSGDTVYFRGMPYQLVVKQGKSAFSVQQDTMVLTLLHPEQCEKVLEKQLSHAFMPYLLAACRQWEPFFLQKGAEKPTEIRLRHMRGMWGNCRPDRRILTFSTMLCEVPPVCVDYVVCHEYAHLLCPNHSAAFYALLAEICPDYLAIRKMLKTKSYR